MLLHQPTSLLRGLYAGLTWRKTASDNSIYLTFDDGPIPELTPFVLRELKKFDAVATFFCVGANLRKHPSIAKDILNSGSKIGNHTYNHLNGWKTDNESYRANIETCQDEITHLGVENTLFRPPYGRIKRTQIKMLKQDYQIVMWDVLSGDYHQKLSREECLAKTIKYTRPGSIVVFHDNLKAQRNLNYVLPRYLAYGRRKGFDFSVL